VTRNEPQLPMAAQVAVAQVPRLLLLLLPLLLLPLQWCWQLAARCPAHKLACCWGLLQPHCDGLGPTDGWALVL
jgi:hypothetical protein